MRINLYILTLMAILGFNSCNKNSEKADINLFEIFCSSIPDGWSCDVYIDSFDSLPEIRGKTPLENPLAVLKYSCSSVLCSNSKPLYLHVYDISKKGYMEIQIAESRIYSWCTPMFFGENEDYYVITSGCFLFNGCWTPDNLEPLFDSIEGLFTESYIEEYLGPRL